ncbi:uncharacterized protein LOC118319457 isoform X3 [Scophthalmus maximus]|uniref:uncharacterized protein LOC118319457 isoform X3 n=1 Tax=Scophthalmus maximus TaxID=52904 RepID=UPI001FA93958|nr:uncharacterized protein LOC118319457 isoform X3 [Scophthalmus maximus]XP_035505748.2 uncharacterized protein LOC118319457 isoform X3 [Scophthalmus maximus]
MDRSHRKKVVNYLSLQGGKSPGESVRCIMREIGTNALWANYSLKGRQGKRKFQDLAIYPVVVQACSKSYPKITLKTVETCIADTLRYAPHRGTRGESNHRKEGERGADMQHMVGIGVEPWTAAGGLQPPVGCRCFNDHNYIVDEAGPSMAESNVAATEGSRSPSLFSESADSE